MISLGQQLLGDYLALLTGRTPEHNVRPDFLRGMELDIWFPGLDLAVEFQGQHHHVPIFGNHVTARTQQGDRLKRELCESNGIVLVQIKISEMDPVRVREIILRKMIAAYGQGPGRNRFFRACPNTVGDRHWSRSMGAYRNRQNVFFYDRNASIGSSKQRRALRCE